MRCRGIRRLISDEIDGSLSPGKRDRLIKHLAACRPCREYGDWLRSFSSRGVQAGGPAVPPGYWESSLARLREKLAALPEVKSEEARRPSLRVPGLRWAWAAATPALLVVAAGIYLALSPSGTPLEQLPLSQEDAAGRLVAMIGSDEALESDFSALIQASLVENSGEPEKDTRRFLYGDSRFLDGLTEDELRRLESHLDKELKI